MQAEKYKNRLIFFCLRKDGACSFSVSQDEGCAALKLLLLNQITRLRSEGCTREAAAAAVAEMLNKQVLTLDPRAVRLQ